MSVALSNDIVFPRRRPPGQTRSVWFVRCKTCEREQGWNDTGSPQEMKEKRLRALGWHVGRHRSGDECPECILARKPIGPLGDAMMRAGLVSPPAAEPTEEKIVELKAKPPTTGPVLVDPPRTPTRADNRRIHEALENAYPKPDAGYEAGFTDEKVAKSLDVPRKWVEDVRSQFFGPAIVFDVAKARQSIDALKEEARKLGDEALAAVERFEAKVAEADQALAALAKVLEHGK